MAVRSPLKISGTSLKEMTTAEINGWGLRMVHLYHANPTVTLSVVASAGSLSSMTDTRKQAGASTTDVTNYDTAAETGNISTVTVTYDKIDETVASVSAPADTSSIRFPLYHSGGNLHSMTVQDMYDTFGDTSVTFVQSLFPYKITTSTAAVTNYTIVSSTPVFSDTAANVGLYTAAGIGETRDQPYTVTNYYLYKLNPPSYGSPSTEMVYVDSAGAVRGYTDAAMDVILSEVVRYAAANSTTHKLRYFIDGAGDTMGSGMVNKIHNGTGNYQQRYVNTNDYRTQEFPNGTLVTANTYYLKSRIV